MSQKQLVGFIGRRGSGKDTAAQALISRGFKNVKFAGALKEMLRTYFRYIGADETMIERLIEGDLKEQSIVGLMGKSPRFAMQTLGTEWGRNLVGDSLWINATFYHANQFDKVVFTDTRFENEVEGIRNNGGIIIRIVRADVPQDFHESEAQIFSLHADYDIVNNGTIDDLHNQVLEIVKP